MRTRQGVGANGCGSGGGAGLRAGGSGKMGVIVAMEELVEDAAVVALQRGRRQRPSSSISSSS